MEITKKKIKEAKEKYRNTWHSHKRGKIHTRWCGFPGELCSCGFFDY